jgi:long-chain acyl-CoA synthetase
VEEVTVIGVPDDKKGEIAKAYVKLKASKELTETELETFLKDRLNPLELPKFYEFRKELPKTMIGKLSKKELREELNKK